ncbi:MAG: amidohydrolase family protein, partial [Thaumarchaeota archaeon]|nr:amidohydrolase family protein [Nitrososphaerota archaeon]
MEYIRFLKERSEYPRFVSDTSSGLVLEYEPKIRIPRQKMLGQFSDASTRLRDMSKNGIDTQVVSIPLPGCDMLDGESAVRICKIANNGLGDLSQKHPSRFIGFALLPIQAGGSQAAEELRRAVNDLGLKGAFLHSNANGLYLDSEEYVSVLREANRLSIPVFVHPTIPHSISNMESHRLATTFGLQADLSLSILRLILSSALDSPSLSSLKIVVSHLGSTLPFISNRMDDELGFAKAPETRITKRPGDYLRGMYVDTVTMDNMPLEFA